MTPTVWRAEMLSDNKVRLNEFTLPLMVSCGIMELFKQDVPPWILEAIDVLAICEVGEHIPNVGKRVSENVYYIEEKVGL